MLRWALAGCRTHFCEASLNHSGKNLLREPIAAFGARVRTAVIYGGDNAVDDAVLHPTYHCRPWKSYRAVAEAIAATLRDLGWQHVECLPDDRHLLETLCERRIQFAWLNTGGVQGRNPMAHTPALLELAGIPYVGHDPLNVTRLDNKHVFKRELQALGLRTPEFVIWNGLSRFDLAHPAFQRVFAHWPGPFVVKPVTGRASLHVAIVDQPKDLASAIAEIVAETHHTVLIERFIEGREYCVAVMGRAGWDGDRFTLASEPLAFSAVERLIPERSRIVPSLDREPIRARLLGTEPDDPQRIVDLHDIALRIHAGFDLEFLTRIDLRRDRDGVFYVLEANPKPDLSHPPAQPGLVYLGLEEAGLKFSDLIANLVGQRLALAQARNEVTLTRFIDWVDPQGAR